MDFIIKGFKNIKTELNNAIEGDVLPLFNSMLEGAYSPNPIDNHIEYQFQDVFLF